MTLSQDAAVRLVDLDDGQVVVGPVSIGAGSTLDVRAGIGADTILEPDAFLTALSSLPSGGRIPQGERWDGIPASPAGQSLPGPQAPDGERVVSPFWHGVALILARFGLWMLLGLSLELPTIALALVHEIDVEDSLSWLFSPSHSFSLFLAAFLMVTVPVPLMVSIEALAVRAMGRVRAGVISRWSLPYVRVWLKTQIVQLAGQIDRVNIRTRATVGSTAVLLYGADIGAGAHVAPHSVVMKRESLLPGRSYSGCPTHPVRASR